MSDFFELLVADAGSRVDCDPETGRVKGRLSGDIATAGWEEPVVSPEFVRRSRALTGATFTPILLQDEHGEHDWFTLKVDVEVDYDGTRTAVADDLYLDDRMPHVWWIKDYSPAPPGWDEADFFRNSFLGGIFLSQRAARSLSGLANLAVEPPKGPMIMPDIESSDIELLAEIRARR